MEKGGAIFPITFNNCGGIFPPRNFSGQKFSHTKFPPPLYSEFLPIAWVSLADIINFTMMCRVLPAKVVIGTLNELFSLLDVEAARHKVEKIKTIGDSCAKLSTSERRDADVHEDARARQIVCQCDALAMATYLFRAMALANGVVRPRPADEDEDKDGNCDFLELRISLHVGPIASSIVGFERPLRPVRRYRQHRGTAGGLRQVQVPAYHGERVADVRGAHHSAGVGLHGQYLGTEGPWQSQHPLCFQHQRRSFSSSLHRPNPTFHSNDSSTGPQLRLSSRRGLTHRCFLFFGAREKPGPGSAVGRQSCPSGMGRFFSVSHCGRLEVLTGRVRSMHGG